MIFPAVLNKISLPDDFAKTVWENWKLLRFSTKVLKSKNNYLKMCKSENKVMTFAFHL
jgi:hypothetical protein